MISEAEIIQLTLESIRNFYSRRYAETAENMADTFVWIGSTEYEWSEGRGEFTQTIKKYENGPPILLSNEEFHLLFHERNVWAVYGRFKVTAGMADGTIYHAHVRSTYIWRIFSGEPKLVHIHNSHAQDIPISNVLPAPKLFTEDDDYMSYLKQLDWNKSQQEKIVFRDRDKYYHYLYPHDIMYLKAATQCCTIHTRTDSFQVWGLLAEYEKKLPDIFRRIHKSYLVNSLYVKSIYRYRAVLQDGQELPIGKERYMVLKRFLQHRLTAGQREERRF